MPNPCPHFGHTCRVKIFWNWLVPKNGGAADELFPLPLYFKLNVTSMDPEEW